MGKSGIEELELRVLLSSIGRRGYLVKYFREALGPGGQVWGADSSPYAAGFVYCDRKLLISEVNHAEYVDHLLDICTKNQIDIVVPLIDPELEVLSRCRQRFKEKDITVLVSPPKMIELSYDKYLTTRFALENGIACPATVLSVEEALANVDKGTMHWPLVVKPRRGSASADIFYCSDKGELLAAFGFCPDAIIQQVIEGEEYGFDLFGAADFSPVSVFCKKKLAMRAGETDKAVSTNDRALIDFGTRLLKALELFGPADVDVIVGKEGPKLIEINPRFGGGYPCSHLAGADFCRKVLALHTGEPLACDIGSGTPNITMLKQDEIICPDWDDLLSQ